MDVLKLEEQVHDIPPILSGQLPPDVFPTWKLPKLNPKLEKQPIVGANAPEVIISDKISILELSLIAAQPPFRIVADLLQLGDFVSVKDEVDFETAAKLLKKYGFVAKRPS
jgi:hypothetical protein